MRGALVPQRQMCTCGQLHQQTLQDSDTTGLCLLTAYAKACQSPGQIEQTFESFREWMRPAWKRFVAKTSFDVMAQDSPK